MEAAAIREFGGQEPLEIMDMPRPEPGEGEVRIRVRAAGVNSVDWKIREGYLKDVLHHEFPVTLGWDVAGVIDALGPGVEGWQPGEAVYAYGRKPVVEEGCFAEEIVLPGTHLAYKPSTLSFVEAAALPLVSLTAWQALDALRLQAGETLLVHAAAGGVGSAAVQLALHRGATVLGTASAPKHEYLQELGVAVPIDYRSQDFREVVRQTCPEGVDAVLDLVGGETLTRSFEVLRESGGRVVTVVDFEGVKALQERGFDAGAIFVEPDAGQLEALRHMVEEGGYRLHVERVLPLVEARKALALSEDGHVTGKLVLEVS